MADMEFNNPQPQAPADKREVAARPFTSRFLLVLSSGLFAVALAIFLLGISTAHAGVIFGPDLATRLLAIEVIVAAFLLALVSSGERIRLTLQMILIYMVVYLLLPGYHHSSGNNFPFFSMQYSHDVRLRAAVIISIFMAALYAGYIVSEQTAASRPQRKTLGRDILFPNHALLVTLTWMSMVSAAVYLAHVGLGAAFSTRVEFGAAGGNILQVGLFVTLPRNITFITLSYCYIIYLRSRKAGLGLYYTALNLIPFLATNFPFVLARFYLFGIILFFLVQTIDMHKAKARSLLTLIFVFGALFAMPYVESLTRQLKATTGANVQSAYNSYIESLDFDGLQSIQNAVIFTDLHGYTNGRQLLSAAFFFVPRSIWPGKGEVTGEITSRAAGYTFNNISQPLPSELFVDFGWIGLAVASALLGVGIARFDLWIDRAWRNGPRAKLIAGVVVAFSIIVMRGSLLGIISAVVTFAAGIALIIRLGLVRPESLRIRRRRRVDDVVTPSPRVTRHARAVAASQSGRTP